ncbi:MAG: transcriptional repressor [Oscillospiraceae bacterium]|nr:transcriptional repressor [Oscillospiraceae bacterium]
MEQTRKHSKKRDAILACVRGTDCHPTADWVFSQLKPEIQDLSLGTVYRNLSMFKQEGTIVSVGVVDGLERFDGRTDRHSHLVCSNCGRVVDVEQLELPETICQEAAEKTGGTVTGWNLQFSGLCDQCKSQK